MREDLADLEPALRGALASDDPDDVAGLVALVRGASRSELRWLALVTAALRLFPEEATSHGRFARKIARTPTATGSPGAYLQLLFDVPLETLRAAVRPLPAPEGGPRAALFHDYLGLRPDWESVPRRDSDLDAREAVEAAWALLAREPSLAGAARADLVAIQAGEHQDVYAVLVTGADPARTIEAFALLVARGPLSSDVVAREFALLAAHRADPEVVSVRRGEAVATPKGPIFGYSSEFLDDFGEMNFLYYVPKDPSAPTRAGFHLASLLPSRDCEIAAASHAAVLATVVRVLVRHYDPAAGTRIGGLSLVRGDIDFHEPAFAFPGDRTASADPARPLRPMLIAWRAVETGVDPARFVEYLLGREYLRPREGALEDVEAQAAPTLRRGVLDGLVAGLVEKQDGVAAGRAVARAWLEAYLAAAARGEVRRDPLFPDEVVRGFIAALGPQRP